MRKIKKNYTKKKKLKNPNTSWPKKFSDGDEEIREHLNYLCTNDENVILKILTGMDSDYNLIYKKYRGNIKNLKNTIYPFTFQFNPLNQYLYENSKLVSTNRLKRPPSLHTYNEYDSIADLLIFEMEDIPTFEWKFTISQIDYIDDFNEIYIDNEVFNPKPIK